MTEEIKPRILAVDDSRVMRRAMTKVLSKEYDVVEAENGEDAWTLLINDDSIQIVFSDLSMPFLDGYGLLERIRTSKDARLSERLAHRLIAYHSKIATRPFDQIEASASR